MMLIVSSDFDDEMLDGLTVSGSKSLLSLRATTPHESRYHAPQCCHLPAALGRVIRIIVTPPVPASFKIALVRNGRRLRIKHDDPVGIGPFIVTKVVSKVTNPAPNLK